MATAASTLPRPVAAPRLSADAWVALALLAFTFALRLPDLGNPAYDIDEQFYLLVGDRLLHGALPYVDIWDRKPIGLFLLYAAIRLLGGDGILQYQLVATLFAGATAVVLARLVRGPAGRLGGLAAGMLYVVWLETAAGGGGQAPIFYDLFVAGAALCVLAAGASEERARFARLAFAAMALIGIAIQIKYTVVVEGAAFGMLLAWWAMRRAPTPAAGCAQVAALAATALAPTAAAFAVYAAIGHAGAFAYANFVSIFARTPSDPAELHQRVGEIALHMLPMSVCFAASQWELRQDRDPATRRWRLLLCMWLAAAIGGLFVVGKCYYHYVLPIYVPLAVGSAPIIRRWPVGPVMLGIALWLPASKLDYPDFGTTAYWQAKTAAVQALIPADVDRGCMQMFAGPPILYHLTHACIVSPYIFPDHLISDVETHAIGVDPHAEIRRLLARRPRVLVIDDRPKHLDVESLAILRQARTRAYRRVGRVMMAGRAIDVWVRRS